MLIGVPRLRLERRVNPQKRDVREEQAKRFAPRTVESYL
jgi:hypothetical protein